jgi:hypothetical protein
LMGWAIASLINEKKIVRFFLTYIAAITFHGLWNSASVGLAIYSVAQEPGKSTSHPWAAALSVVTFAALIVVFLIILIVSNRKLSASTAAEPAPPLP